jgi:hypothetical protein
MVAGKGLPVRLQGKLNRTMSEIQLDANDIEQIGRYAFDYGTDGLVSMFGRTLGPTLGG